LGGEGFINQLQEEKRERKKRGREEKSRFLRFLEGMREGRGRGKKKCTQPGNLRLEITNINFTVRSLRRKKRKRKKGRKGKPFINYLLTLRKNRVRGKKEIRGAPCLSVSQKKTTKGGGMVISSERKKKNEPNRPLFFLV